MLNVEIGAGAANSESYVSLDGFKAYCAARGLDLGVATDPQLEQALRRATAFIDSRYRARFPGFRAQRRLQALEWPRIGAYYFTPGTDGPSPYFVDPNAISPYDAIPVNAIPVEIVNATCEAAVRETAEPGALQPDLERGGAVRRFQAGSVVIDYSASAPVNTTFQAIEAALSGLLVQRSMYSAKAVRG